MESANIVGYNNVTLNPGFNMFAVNFKQMGEKQSIKLDDLFPGGGKEDTIFTYAGTSADADYVKIWSNATGEYDTYYLFKKSKGSSDDNFFWLNESDDSRASNVTFKNGDAFWFYKRGDVAISTPVSGEVELSEVKSVEIKPGFNMIASFFPSGWTINDNKYYTPSYWENSGAVYAGTSADSDYLKVWDNKSNEYTTYYLFKKAKGSDENNFRWLNESDDSLPTGNVLTPGKGAWYFHRGSGFNLEIKKQF